MSVLKNKLASEMTAYELMLMSVAQELSGHIRIGDIAPLSIKVVDAIDEQLEEKTRSLAESLAKAHKQVRIRELQQHLAEVIDPDGAMKLHVENWKSELASLMA